MFRTPTPEDLPALAVINNLYLGRGTMQLDPTVPGDFTAYLPEESDRHGLLLAEEKHTILGYALVKPYSPRRGYALAGETSVYLRPDATGKGLGKALMEHILTIARDLGYRHLTAKIWTENTRSVDFHLALGFRRVGVQRGIGWVDNRRVDVTILENLLA